MTDPRKVCVGVVDDDESLCRPLERMLQASGMQTVFYPSGEAFLADTDRAPFDCLILDIELGGLSGIELSQRLAASGLSTPVIFHTGHGAPELRQQALSTRPFAYLLKSDSAGTLLASIREAVGLPPIQETQTDSVA